MRLPVNEIVTGDCMEVMRTWPDECVDMVLTDPPYGHNNNNGDLIHKWEDALGIRKTTQEDARPICNDGEEANELFHKCIMEYSRILKPNGCCCCCCGGGGPDPQFARWSLWIDQSPLTFCQMVVWDKGPIGMGWRYRRSYETVLVAFKGSMMRWYDTSKKIENIIRHIPKIIPQKTDHPTVKPTELMRHFIRLHTQEEDLVLDPFCGSGTTCIAAWELHRNYIGIELSPEYAAMARRRIEAARAQYALIEKTS